MSWGPGHLQTLVFTTTDARCIVGKVGRRREIRKKTMLALVAACWSRRKKVIGVRSAQRSLVTVHTVKEKEGVESRDRATRLVTCHLCRMSVKICTD